MPCIIRYSMGMKLFLLCITLLLGAVLPAYDSDAYRCKAKDGKTTYSNVNLGIHCQKITQSVTVAPAVPSERFEPPKSAQANHRSGRAQQITLTGKKENTATKAPTAPANRTSIVSQDPNQVAPQAQRSRDQKRRDILTEELEIEEKNLSQLRVYLVQQETAYKKANQPLSGLDSYRRQVKQHEKNIEAIKRELARIR